MLTPFRSENKALADQDILFHHLFLTKTWSDRLLVFGMVFLIFFLFLPFLSLFSCSSSRSLLSCFFWFINFLFFLIYFLWTEGTKRTKTKMKIENNEKEVINILARLVVRFVLWFPIFYLYFHIILLSNSSTNKKEKE